MRRDWKETIMVVAMALCAMAQAALTIWLVSRL